MSQENVEIVREGMQAFNARERDRWLSLCDPALEFVPSGDWPEAATVRGREAVWDFSLQADEPWEPGAYELVEVIDASDRGVVAHQVRDARGRDSGAIVRYDYWTLYTFRADKVIRVEWFATRRDALKAAGLEE